MAELACLSAIVHGRVQGVYFRAFTERQAQALGLTGYARNLPNGRSVEVLAEGERNRLEELVNRLKVGPPGAWVEEVEIKWGEYSNGFDCFRAKY